MKAALESSVYFGVFATLFVYFAGLLIRRKTGLSIFNPLMIAVLLMITLLSLLDIDYAAYQSGASIISSLLTPATICLAVPLYEQFSMLKKHPLAIFLGILSGVVTSLFCVLILSLLFHLDHLLVTTVKILALSL